MTRIYTIILIFLIVVCAIIITGCVSQTRNERSNITISLSKEVPSYPTVRTTALVTPTPKECPVPRNGSYWIAIDPISNVSMGNPVFINGSTNIPTGIVLNFDISKVQWRASPSSDMLSHVSGIINIKKTDNCTNQFSIFSNTTDLGGPNLFEVFVWTEATYLNGPNFPDNRSEFYIIRQMPP
jgi:hypothetical protein